MAANENEEDRLIRQQVVNFKNDISLIFCYPQRLKAAMHYAVGRACEDVG